MFWDTMVPIVARKHGLGDGAPHCPREVNDSLTARLRMAFAATRRATQPMSPCNLWFVALLSGCLRRRHTECSGLAGGFERGIVVSI